ncbi:MAG: cobalamin-dependent protein, partial [Polyangiaceae bacterium]|nr:cobalamin-dependent protein [Polyangiaceae bacterium]
MHVVLVGAELEENLAIRYLAGALERALHRVSYVVFDGPDDVERAAREIVASGARIAGYSMVFTHRARQFVELATRARALGYAGFQVAGGHFAAFHAE